MTVNLVALVLSVMAAIFGVIVVRGLITGRASTRSIRSVSRAEHPALYWSVQGFNTLFFLIALTAALYACDSF